MLPDVQDVDVVEVEEREWSPDWVVTPETPVVANTVTIRVTINPELDVEALAEAVSDTVTMRVRTQLVERIEETAMRGTLRGIWGVSGYCTPSREGITGRRGEINAQTYWGDVSRWRGEMNEIPIPNADAIKPQMGGMFEYDDSMSAQKMAKLARG